LKQRTSCFALELFNSLNQLPKRTNSGVLGGQLLRSGTFGWIKTIAVPVGPSLSQTLLSKMGIVEEEADEIIVLMELLIEVG